VRRPDGGPAFPHSSRSSAADGMTLRDYFAIRATEQDINEFTWSSDLVTRRTREEARYAFADAMLVARKGGA
jgi:hypothetical protein